MLKNIINEQNIIEIGYSTPQEAFKYLKNYDGVRFEYNMTCEELLLIHEFCNVIEKIESDVPFSLQIDDFFIENMSSFDLLLPIGYWPWSTVLIKSQNATISFTCLILKNRINEDLFCKNSEYEIETKDLYPYIKSIK